MIKWIVAAAFVLVLIAGGYFLFYGLGYKTNTNPTTNNTAEPTAPNAVSIQNFAFNPDTVTVKKGTKVTWTNNDSVVHTVTASDKTFDSGHIDPGGSFSFTFDKAGTFSYSCSIHTFMHGKIVVQ